jgi:hypothetical protein
MLAGFGIALAVGLSCSDDDANTGGSGASAPSGSTGSSTGGHGGGFQSSSGQGPGSSVSTYSSANGAPPTQIVTCEGHTYDCGDLQDNDGDGLIDYQDPDCLGPCDNTEDSYFGGIPGQNNSPCRQDCYFDEDSGHGDDDCFWNHKCDPNSVPPNFYPEPQFGGACAYDPGAMTPGTMLSCAQLEQTQSQLCLDFCGPLTPNGCDCFGCCELPAGSGAYVWLGSQGADGTTVCTEADIADPTKCHPCLPVAACLNPCGPCELCVGKPTLDPGCTGEGGGTTNGQCDPGVQPCGLQGQEECPANHYCITGCCIAVPQ